jgi:hypothetical protein
MASKKKAGGGSAAATLRGVMTSTAATETIIDLVSKLGLVDIVVGRLKSRIEETDIDDLFDEVADYLKRNPEVLVVSLGAVTVATGMLVWLNSRREWDGSERREASATRTTSSTGRVRRTAPVAADEDDD